MSDWPIHPAAELFPLLGGEELRDLADDIREHGLIEPVWLWRDPERGMVLLDGRNRVAACQLVAVKVATRRYEGSDPWTFVISENIMRRHLTAMQKASIAHRSLPFVEAEMKAAEAQRKRLEIEAQRHKTAALVQQSKSDGAKSRRAPSSVDKAARTAGTSGRSLAQYKRIVEQAPDLLPKLDAGMSGARAERIIRDRDAEQRRIAQARAEAEAQPEVTRVDIRIGDFREVLTDLQDVDAVITDPPYPAEFLPLLGDLALWSDKVLKPDGVLAVLIGQSHLPEVYRLLAAGRPYRWTACYLTPGNGYASMARRCQSNWKPLLIYGGGPRFADVIRSGASDADAKNNHKWGQDYNAFHTIVERLTSRGQTVVDPFMGSGTTLLAAYALGRHAVGCDIDAEHVARARERVG